MAVRTIEFPTYRFKEPSVLSEHDYNIIKQGLLGNDNFYPFPEDGFIDKFKIHLMFYIIGGPIATLLAFIENTLVGFIGAMYILGLFIKLIVLVPEMISYSFYLSSRNRYFKKLLRTIKNSYNYRIFVKEMYNINLGRFY